MTEKKINNIAFEGGGIKAIAYTGVVKALSRYGFLSKINGWAGTSAGAIMAMLCALRVRTFDLYNISTNMDFTKFQDDSPFIMSDILRVYNKFGFYKGNNLKIWLGWICRKYGGNTNITFLDLFNKYDSELAVIATNMQNASPKIFNKYFTPDIPIKDAVHASCAIPFYYVSPKIFNQYFVDGGVTANYPIYVFDEFSEDGDRISNNATIGCKLIGDPVVLPINEKGTFKGHVKTLLKIILEQIGKMHVQKEDWERSIKIDVENISFTDFNMPRDKKNKIINNAYKATQKFLLDNGYIKEL